MRHGRLGSPCPKETRLPKSSAETLRRDSPVVRAGFILIMLSLLAPITTLHAGAVANCPAVVVCFTPGEHGTETIVKRAGGSQDKHLSARL
jgi:hypothetical protein